MTGVTRFEPWSEHLEAEWEALATEQGVEPFLRPGWVRAVREAFFPRDDLQLLTVRTDGRLDALLPLRHGRIVLTSPTNWHTPSYGPVSRDEAALQRLAEGLMAASSRRLHLEFLEPGPVLAALTAAARRRSRGTIDGTLERSPYVDVSDDWETYQERFSGSWRRNIRRRWRRLADAGAVTFDLSDGGADLPALLAEGLDVELRSWKGRRGTAIAADPAATRFYGDVAAWASELGMLRLAFLRVDARAAAFVLLLEDAGTLYALKTAYDPSYGNSGPGTLHMLRIIEHACGDGQLKTLELLGAEDAWKLELAAGSRTKLAWTSFRPGTVGRLERGAVALGVRSKHWAAEHVPDEAWERLSDARRRATATAGRLLRRS